MAKTKSTTQRKQIAELAARLMVERNIHDYHKAKSKACTQLGMQNKQHLPNNQEVQDALIHYLKIFKGEAHTQYIHTLRTAAAAAMQFLKDFEPRLVGAVLNGTALDNAFINIHVFADPEEKILEFLIDKKIPYKLSIKEIHYRNQRTEQVSVCEIAKNQQKIMLHLFNSMDLRQAPCSPVDGKPMRRADTEKVQELLTMT